MTAPYLLLRVRILATQLNAAVAWQWVLVLSRAAGRLPDGCGY
jgi:hypothetical protein